MELHRRDSAKAVPTLLGRLAQGHYKHPHLYHHAYPHHHPHSRILDLVYQELLPDKSCNIVDIGAHGGDTTLPLALVARFSREQC